MRRRKVWQGHDHRHLRRGYDRRHVRQSSARPVRLPHQLWLLSGLYVIACAHD